MSEAGGRHKHVSWVARHPRRRAVLGVALGLGLLVVVNAVVRQPGGVLAGGRFVGPPSLPVVQMLKPGDWRCPGPLPVGAGKESSRISIVNSTTAAVNLLVVVSRTGLPKGGVSVGASISRTRFAVGGDSQAVFPLTTRGAAGFAAVSVETDAGGIGVGESIVGASTLGGGVLLSSPCSLIAAGQGYVPTGSTYGGSDVRLSLYDPDATPAVVNVDVSTGTTLTSPPAFQGVVVPATGLVVLDLHRWVFEESSLAVTATAVSGSIVVGALELTSETVDMASRSAAGHSINHVVVIGSSLLVGPDRGLSHWAFAALQSKKGVASTFSVYNPGKRPVSVSVAPPGRAGIVAALTEDVPAGGIVDFATPVTGTSGLGTGSVVVSAKGGMPIVVARLTTRYRTRLLENIDATPGTAGPEDDWLLPGSSLTPLVGDVVTIEVPGTTGATVTLYELNHKTPPLLEVLNLNAGSELELNLDSLLRYAPSFALRVSANAPILVEQQLTPSGGLTTATGGIPVLG
ncbi:MAG: hypothetical protein ABSA14_04520 [Acidimicrobiales bacterium]|jgi:hypothetical protein